MSDNIEFVGNGPMVELVAQMPVDIQQDFVAKVAQLQQWAVSKQGLRALASRRADSAAHEAGHCVFYASIGVPVGSAEIWPKPWPMNVPEALGTEYWCGLTIPEMEPREIGPQTSPHVLLEFGLELIAGWMGEVLLRGQKFRAGSSADEVAYADFVLRLLADQRGMQVDEVIGMAQREAETRLSENMDALRAVELALLRHRKIDREQAAKLLTGVKVKALTA